MTKGDILKNSMLTALKANLGNVSKSCEAVGISRQTHYRWLEEDPEYKESVEEVGEHCIDFVEGKLFELIDGVQVEETTMMGEKVVYQRAPCKTSAIFFLKTKGRKRGYDESITVNLPPVIKVGYGQDTDPDQGE